MECSTCFDCKHMSYSPGSPGYSELTPGWEADLSCIKNHWVYDGYNDTLKTIRAKLYSSRTCKDFEPSLD